MWVDRSLFPGHIQLLAWLRLQEEEDGAKCGGSLDLVVYLLTGN